MLKKNTFPYFWANSRPACFEHIFHVSKLFFKTNWLLYLALCERNHGFVQIVIFWFWAPWSLMTSQTISKVFFHWLLKVSASQKCVGSFKIRMGLSKSVVSQRRLPLTICGCTKWYLKKRHESLKVVGSLKMALKVKHLKILDRDNTNLFHSGSGSCFYQTQT